jgi:hypothetical protein
VKINAWHADSLTVEKLCDGDIVAVLVALIAIFYKDQRVAAADLDAVVFAIRAALFERTDSVWSMRASKIMV